MKKIKAYFYRVEITNFIFTNTPLGAGSIALDLTPAEIKRVKIAISQFWNVQDMLKAKMKECGNG